MQSLETKNLRPRPKSFETETRPETFETETETSTNGFRDASPDRDQVSRLHHWLLSNQDNLDLKPPSFIWRQAIHALQ